MDTRDPASIVAAAAQAAIHAGLNTDSQQQAKALKPTKKRGRGRPKARPKVTKAADGIDGIVGIDGIDGIDGNTVGDDGPPEGIEEAAAKRRRVEPLPPRGTR